MHRRPPTPGRTTPSRSTTTRTTAIALTTAACTIGAVLFAAGPADAATRHTLPDSTPAWATSANDAGTVAASTDVEGEVYLPLQDQRGAEALATAVSTPGTAQYRKPLSPAAWIKRFAPTKADADQVTGYLRAQGLTITAVPASHEFVVFRGAASVVNSVLGVSLHEYQHAGRTLVAPSSAPSLPASIAGLVSGVSVDQGRLLTHPELVQQGETPATSTPARSLKQQATGATGIQAKCSQYDGQNTATVPAAYGKTSVHTFACGYVPKQIRSAYGVDGLAAKGVQGQGQTVAIIDAYASPSIVHDTNSYSAQNGEPALTSATFQQRIPSPSEFTDQVLCQQPSGWQGEETLDVQSVHAVAPAAKIFYVGGTNCGGGLDVAMSKVLDQGLANLVSNSYGDVGENVPLSSIRGQENLHIQAAGEGIGLYFSSGDNGDESASLGSAQPDFPASSPWVTAVGGTSLGIGKNGRKTFETGWGDVLDQIVSSDRGNVYSTPLPGGLVGGGAGGGRSTLFAQPAYQKGVVPASLAGGQRVSPDLAALADPYTGFSIGIRPITDDTTLATGDFVNETYGGTSLASPLTAALSALVQQSTHTRLGFANPTLYATYRAAPSAFSDVRPPSSPIALAYTSATSGKDYLVTLDRDTSLTTARGYDDVTGLGAVSFTGMTQVARR
ncbi:Subtilase family protein [Curtobacterium sp. UNCCL20]|uniref:S53 family peptidase n=1 Tax=Curtobacterium sp. UNCCL20 TaxID=1502773 RepID=UPI00088EC90D|nr:S53 family peptidase [Curtobacterium sp. UNCCL20]SDQ70264.1 Subtilase family protein [Curtobacterium sp. UNCCL20]